MDAGDAPRVSLDRAPAMRYEPGTMRPPMSSRTLVVPVALASAFVLVEPDFGTALFLVAVGAAVQAGVLSGEVKDLLNVEISRESGCVVLRQSGYIDHLVDTYLPDGLGRAVRTPADEDLPKRVDAAVAARAEVVAPPAEDAALQREKEHILDSSLRTSFGSPAAW